MHFVDCFVRCLGYQQFSPPLNQSFITATSITNDFIKLIQTQDFMCFSHSYNWHTNNIQTELLSNFSYHWCFVKCFYKHHRIDIFIWLIIPYINISATSVYTHSMLLIKLVAPLGLEPRKSTSQSRVCYQFHHRAIWQAKQDLNLQ